MVILIDTGSTHNFIDPSIIRGAHLSYDNQERLKVKVVNGQTMECEGKIIVVLLQMQGNVYSVDFFYFNTRWM